jgi:hypothetical protein
MHIQDSSYFRIAGSDDLYPRYFDFPELEKHPGIPERLAIVLGILTKSFKNRKNAPPSGTGVFGRNTSDITGVNGHKMV